MPDDRVFDTFEVGPQPPYRSDSYGSTGRMAPRGLIELAPRTATELSGPRFPAMPEADRNLAGETGAWAIGQLMRLVVRVLDEDARPQKDALVEIWQANAAGKYQHPQDQRNAPLDGNFRSWGRGLTDETGEVDFLTVKPGAYPVPSSGGWWRPPHIHISAYGESFLSRIVSQLYFPGEPLNGVDGILQGIPDAKARERLVCTVDPGVGIPEMALGYRFDLVLRGRAATPVEA
ncbi:MAG: protocatechuate 3,4-dioxygenase subunit beta [Bauldia litoralis]